MKNKANKIKKNVMRRVYYAYTLRMVTHPIVLHVAVLMVAGYVLARMVHVAAVLKNTANVQLGDLGVYVLQTFMQADVASLFMFGIVVFAVLSLPLRLPQYKHMQIA